MPSLVPFFFSVLFGLSLTIDREPSYNTSVLFGLAPSVTGRFCVMILLWFYSKRARHCTVFSLFLTSDIYLP